MGIVFSEFFEISIETPICLRGSIFRLFRSIRVLPTFCQGCNKCLRHRFFALPFNVSRGHFSLFFPILSPPEFQFFRFSFFPNEGNNIGWISNDAGSQRIDRDRREKISDLKKAQIVLFIHETCTIDENFERSSGRSTVSCVQTQRFNE